jgi:hypothetical protein
MPYRAFDKIEIRCPQLGGEVNFGYCRTVAQGLPCSRALVCFELKFPVAAYFERVLKPETYDRVFNTPQPGRLEKFLSTVHEAKKRVGEQG